MGKPRPHVLGPELGDDLRARGGLVAQDAGDPGPAHECGDQLGGEAVRETGQTACPG